MAEILETRMAERCATCAFRPGSFAAQDGITQHKVRLCITAGAPFLCHESTREAWCAGMADAIESLHSKGKFLAEPEWKRAMARGLLDAIQRAEDIDAAGGKLDDATVNDPSVVRMMGFSRSWGMGGFYLVNLFALRSTDPSALAMHPAPVGPYNDDYILEWTGGCTVVAAWGAHRFARDRAESVRRLLVDGGRRLQCFGLTSGGYPKHPLYLPASCELVPFPVEYADTWSRPVPEGFVKKGGAR